MPAFATHYLFEQDMFCFCEKKADFKFNQNAAQIGTQGPDIFYFHRAFPWMIGKPLRKVGSQLHRTKPSLIFDAFCEYCKISKNIDIAKSYIYGFICHYALDSTCHPYIYYWQNKLVKSNDKLKKSSAHNLVELGLDSYMLNKKLNIQNPKTFNSFDVITSNKSIISECANVISYMVSRVTNFKVTPSQVSQGIIDLKTCQKYVCDSTGKLEKFANVFDDVTGPITGYYKISAMIRPKDLENCKKYGNIYNSVWHSPYNIRTSRNESFEDLFELAKCDAKRLINGFENICNGTDSSINVTKDISFLTGEKIK